MMECISILLLIYLNQWPALPSLISPQDNTLLIIDSTKKRNIDGNSIWERMTSQYQRCRPAFLSTQNYYNSSVAQKTFITIHAVCSVGLVLHCPNDDSKRLHRAQRNRSFLAPLRPPLTENAVQIFDWLDAKPLRG